MAGSYPDYFLPVANPYLEIAKGVVPGHSCVTVRGHNPDIDSSSGLEKN